jgi:hypothetical protein
MKKIISIRSAYDFAHIAPNKLGSGGYRNLLRDPKIEALFYLERR